MVLELIFLLIYDDVNVIEIIFILKECICGYKDDVFGYYILFFKLFKNRDNMVVL